MLVKLGGGEPGEYGFGGDIARVVGAIASASVGTIVGGSGCAVVAVTGGATGATGATGGAGDEVVALLPL